VTSSDIGSLGIHSSQEGRYQFRSPRSFMLAGKRPDIPWGKAPFAKAPTEKEKAQQDALL